MHAATDQRQSITLNWHNYLLLSAADDIKLFLASYLKYGVWFLNIQV